MEHINYFSVNSLAKLLTMCGFSIISIGEIFQGAHIAAYVKKEKRTNYTFDEKKKLDVDRINKIIKEYSNISIWGAGIKGREYIQNLSQINLESYINHIFDNNKSIKGSYIANCAIPIELPSFDAVNENNIIIVTAIEYKGEITNELRNKYGYCGEIFYIEE